MRQNGTSVVIAVCAALIAGCGGTEEPASSTELLQRDLSITAPAAVTVGAATLRLSSAGVIAGETVTGTVTLSSAAQSANGVVVYVSFDARVLAGPRFIRVPNGQSNASFTLYTNPFLATATPASITANTSTPDAAVYLTQTVSVAPSAAAPAGPVPQVASIAVTPSSVTTGTPASGTVTLTSPAPAGGATVRLSIPNDFFEADADLPPVLVVPAGATAAAFTVRTHLSSGVTSATESIVANFFGGAFQGASLIVGAATSASGTATPSSPGTPSGTSPCATGQSPVTLTVSGSAGSVTSSPSSLSVTTGATATACFGSNTRVELLATRRGNWSGVTCDGGNSGQDRCRFTTTSAGATVSAALQ